MEKIAQKTDLYNVLLTGYDIEALKFASRLAWGIILTMGSFLFGFGLAPVYIATILSIIAIVFAFQQNVAYTQGDWDTYKRAWKQNWRQSLVPGALLGLFVGSWAWMLRAQAESGNTSTALWVASFAGIFVCTGFFTWLLAQVPLVDLPLVQIAKNAGLMFFGFFPRTAAAALVLAWQQAQSDGSDYIQHSQLCVERMKRNITRYITIL